uniref:Venom allergen 3 n=1 Tax=Ampulex compressa TaxID=860918 RepID=A0A1W6EVU9_AMPCP|nr:venom allergen 3 [Ampulex compressa]
MKTVCGLLSIIVTLFAVSTAKNYCNVKSCVEQGLNHTMCKYPNPAPGKLCGKREHIATGVRKKQIEIILQTHNKLRAYVAAGNETRGAPGPQPPASNIAPLTWDPELATIAQRWANRCTFSTVRVEHDKCRNVEKYDVGQNVGYKDSANNDRIKISDIISEWYNEVEFFDAALVPNVTDYGIFNHYTQIVAANTKTIGCGLIRYKPRGVWNALYLVCNYGPDGNLQNEELYKIRTVEQL